MSIEKRLKLRKSFFAEKGDSGSKWWSSKQLIYINNRVALINKGCLPKMDESEGSKKIN